MKPDEVVTIVNKYKGKRGGMISILEEVQSKYGYLPEDGLRVVAETTGRSLVDIYGVATFYRSFRLRPRGKHLVSVCLGTACHVRGGPDIAKGFENQLRVCACGDTTPDREFTLESVRCLGACALGPIVVVDGHYFSNVNTSGVPAILQATREDLDRRGMKTDRSIFPLEVSCPRCNHSLMDPDHLIDGYPSIRLTVSFGHEHGWLRLSCLYGSYSIELGNEVPVDTVVNFFCPHCHEELIGAWNCTVCGAPMVPMIVRGGAIVQICSRRGCKSHMLDVEGTNI